MTSLRVVDAVCGIDFAASLSAGKAALSALGLLLVGVLVTLRLPALAATLIGLLPALGGALARTPEEQDRHEHRDERGDDAREVEADADADAHADERR